MSLVDPPDSTMPDYIKTASDMDFWQRDFKWKHDMWIRSGGADDATAQLADVVTGVDDTVPEGTDGTVGESIVGPVDSWIGFIGT